MKINANELRLGNYLRDAKLNKVIQFTSFFGLCNVESNPDDYEPIPLTEEWPLKFGFENFHDWQIQLDDPYRFLVIMVMEDQYYPVLEAAGELSREVGQIFHLNKIQYVHQLQNLFYALTGKELEFTDK